MKLTFLPRNRTFGLLDALGITGAVGFLIARFIPVARLPFWGCRFREVTGWPCPGCGLTRVADRLAHLHPLGAFWANPLGTLAAILLALAVVYTVLHFLFALPTPDLSLEPHEATRARVVLAIVFVTNYAFVAVQTRYLHFG